MIINAKIAGQCNHKGCDKKAEFNVCFALRVNDKHPPAVSTPIIQVCGEHMDVKWEDIYTPEGWEMICNGMVKMGYARPEIEYSYLEIKTIIP